jgi:hypothetical protein
MSDRLLERMGAACGILYVVLSILGNEVLGGAGGGPETGASAETIGAYYSSLPAPGVMDWTALSLVVLALLCFMVFVVYLSSVLRRAEGEGGWLSTAALSGGLLTVAVNLGGIPPSLAALLIRMYEGLDPQVAAALFYVSDGAHILVWVPTTFLFAPSAIVVIHTRVLPRWLGWAAAVIAVGLPVNLVFAALGFAPPVFLLLNLIWIIAVSVVLFMRAGELRLVEKRDAPAGRPASVG